MVHVHVVGLVETDLGAPGRVVDDDVGVEAGLDRSLAAVEAEHARRSCRAQLDPSLKGDLAVDDTLVDEVHPVLDGTDAVGNLREVAESELLLLLEAERAVVSAHDGEIIRAQVLPQLVLMALGLAAQGSGADPLRPLEARLREVVLEREVEVLRAGLAEDIPALVAGLLQDLHRLLRRHVDDVQRRAGHAGEHDRSVRCLCFGLPRPGERVVSGVGLTLGKRLRDEHVDSDAVLGVHHDHRAVVGRGLHGSKDLAVVAVEDPGVGHEELETCHAFIDKLIHRLERIVIDTADDLVEAVVDVAFASSLVMPGGKAILHSLALGLNREVDDGRGAAPRSGPGARLEGVGGVRAAEGQLHVRVAVDAAGNDVLPGGVDDAVCCRLEAGPERGIALRDDCRDALAIDEHVGIDDSRG